MNWLYVYIQQNVFRCMIEGPCKPILHYLKNICSITLISQTLSTPINCITLTTKFCGYKWDVTAMKWQFIRWKNGSFLTCWLVVARQHDDNIISDRGWWQVWSLTSDLSGTVRGQTRGFQIVLASLVQWLWLANYFSVLTWNFVSPKIVTVKPIVSFLYVKYSRVRLS